MNSISSATGRLVHDGARAAQVRPDASAKQQIAALVDLIDLHLAGASLPGVSDEGRLVLRVPQLASEARGALGTLIESRVDETLTIDVLEAAGDDWVAAPTGWNASDPAEYSTWPALLAQQWKVPGLVTDVVERVAVPGLRAYPRLSTRGKEWSLRLEGLEVGRGTASRLTLGVGKDGVGDARSRQRDAWIAATKRADTVETESADEAAALVSRFIVEWQQRGAGQVEQDEHALESRILRGEALIAVRGLVLSRVPAHHVVNWGSQFPTKWGPGGSARYLDALLADGTTPWAIEMKVAGSAGVGSYYRQAVTQAVLYREFIRRATPLHFWFEERGLEAARCEAAVVVPRLPPAQEKWRTRLQALTAYFGAEFVEVDPAHARRY
ncbi:hypothetical protein ACOACO_02755 [Nocardioides sp. CPCC 205120]|uniref:hypothetical protein n=1 Tax=Nocardioides sp. CPCC 205120 TaxID=3406462 RepID=UPI003B50132D